MCWISPSLEAALAKTEPVRAPAMPGAAPIEDGGQWQGRVAVLGNLANVGYRFAWSLRKAGVHADLFFGWEGPGADPRRETGGELPEWCVGVGPLRAENERPRPASWGRLRDSARYRLGLVRLARALREYDVVQSVDGWNSFPPATGRPFATFACGADLAEVAYESSRRGRKMLEAFRRSGVVLFGNISQLPYLDHLGLRRRRFVPYAMDLKTFRPPPSAPSAGGPTVFFAPTQLVWDHRGRLDRYDGLGMPRGKGNDRLLRALRIVLDEGRHVRAVMVEHGPDAARTKRLVRDLELEGDVGFVAPLGKTDLVRWYRRADVVADQFEIGSFGLITLEAMACGKPVLVGLRDEWLRRCYDREMPVLEASSVDGIAARMLEACDPRVRAHVGDEARRFVEAEHSPERTAAVLVGEYQGLAEGVPRWAEPKPTR